MIVYNEKNVHAFNIIFGLNTYTFNLLIFNIGLL